MKRKAKRAVKRRKIKSKKQSFFSRNSGWIVAGIIVLLALGIFLYKLDISGNIIFNPSSSTSGPIISICYPHPCTAPQICQFGVCVDPCTPATCGSRNCGNFPNGTCAGTLNCGTCGTSQTCSPTGFCIPSSCTPATCGTKTCGTYANGTCAGTLNCGTCGHGYFCNTTGQCVGSGACKAATCASVVKGGGAYCGNFPNGTCAGTLNCGTCPSGQTCNETGRCVSLVHCSSDSNCGTNYYSSAYCSGNSIYHDYTNYTCKNPGLSDSYCSVNTTSKFVSSCSSGETCQNGQCVSDSSVLAYYTFEKNLKNTINNKLLESSKTLHSSHDYTDAGEDCDNWFLETTAGNATDSSPLILYNTGADSDEFGTKEPFSISLWTKFYEGNGAYSDIVSKYENYRISARDDVLSFAVKDDNDDWVEISADVNTEEWIFVTATYDGSDISLYVNGELMDSATLDNELASPISGKNFVIFSNEGNGGNSVSSFLKNCNTSSELEKSECVFHGAIDELIFWNYSLSESDVNDRYSNDDEYSYDSGSDYFFDCGENDDNGDKTFEFGVLTCSDSACTDETDSFTKGQKVYFDFYVFDDSEGADLEDDNELADFVDDMNITATINYPGTETKTIKVPGNLVFNTAGDYTFSGRAKKPGYKIGTYEGSFVVDSSGTTTDTDTDTTNPPNKGCNDDGRCQLSRGETIDNCPNDCVAVESGELSPLLVWTVIILIALILITAGILAYVFYKKKKDKKGMKGVEAA